MISFWLLVIILSYLFFSFSYFGDKLILSAPPNAKFYAFYVGVIGICVVLLIPFTKLIVPSPLGFLWITIEAATYILGLYSMFLAVGRFEVSKVIPAIGALQPIFILMLTWLLVGFETLTGTNLLAFALLLVGSIIISFEKKFKVTKEYLLLVIFASLMFSCDFVFSKLVFLEQPFLSGLIWMRVFSFFFALIFLFDTHLRERIFSKKASLSKKTRILAISTQLIGGFATVLQSYAISLAPIAYLALLNSLRGIQYVFLFINTLIFSLFFPKVLKEDVSKKIILQKTLSILLIVVGLGILILF